MKRILIVDDEKNVRLTLSRSLSALGVGVDLVISAEEALDRLAIYPYDLMILDIRLPGMSGLDLIEALKELDISVKTIVISAHGTIEAAVSCLKSGALDFIEKPFSPDEIRAIVAKYI
ncbi:MAG: response regulator [Candidatus Cloacimonadota bacterium]